EKGTIMPDVWTEATDGNCHLLTFEFTYFLRKLKQIECFFECDGLNHLPGSQAGIAGFLLIVCRSNLHHRTEAANSYTDPLACSRFHTQFPFVCCPIGMLSRGFDLLMEWPIETMQHGRPLLHALCNLVKLFLHLGSEIEVYNPVEVLNQKIVDHHADIGRK